MGRPRKGTAPKIETNGLCACGCGQTTPVSDRFQEKNGAFYEKGQHFLYCPGHSGDSIEARFWNKVDRRTAVECWLWQGGFRNGYGRLSYRNQGVSMHRFSYELAHGPVPDGLFVLHRCGNKACVNPAHLYAGTPSDNNRDTVEHGHCNPRRGERSKSAKLTEDGIRDIRARFASGVPARVLATEYGMSTSGLYSVISRKNWAHVQ